MLYYYRHLNSAYKVESHFTNDDARIIGVSNIFITYAAVNTYLCIKNKDKIIYNEIAKSINTTK
jgi:hypothetical protein